MDHVQEISLNHTVQYAQEYVLYLLNPSVGYETPLKKHFHHVKWLNDNEQHPSLYEHIQKLKYPKLQHDVDVPTETQDVQFD